MKQQLHTKVEVRRVSYDDTKPFLLRVHYARRMPCIQYAFGLFADEKLVGVVTYGKPASPPLCKGVAGEENRHRVLELNRLAIIDDCGIHNAASFLVGNSLRMLPHGMIVVSYADAEGWGHIGYVYQATNFFYSGMTKPRTDKYSESGHARHYKDGEKRRQYRTAKHRHIYITGSRSDVRYLRKQIKYPLTLCYPKGVSQRYDTNDPIPLIGRII